MTTVAVWQTVQQYADLCSLPSIKPHDFRRFVGTQLARANIRQAQQALGHKSIETTARHYDLNELEVGLTDTLYEKDGGPLGLWRQWAPQAHGQSMKGGHFFPEENPDETAALVKRFISA